MGSQIGHGRIKMDQVINILKPRSRWLKQKLVSLQQNIYKA